MCFTSCFRQEPGLISSIVRRNQQEPIRVLALFDGIATSYIVLKNLRLDIGTFATSEFSEDATKVNAADAGSHQTTLVGIKLIIFYD